MRAAVSCRYNGRFISVADALRIRDQEPGGRAQVADFLCPECGGTLRVHRAGENTPAHFEHHARNYSCPHSARPRPARTSPAGERLDVNDPRAIEGYEKDLLMKVYARSAALAEQCKRRDNFTCQVCGLRLQVRGSYVVECHHLFPVALAGEREVDLEDLVTLCPTCHRIAHTRRHIPLNLSEIEAERNGL